MAGDWYYAQGDQRLGPVSLAELRSFLQSGRIQKATLVWTDGMQDWLPAAEVRALSSGEPAENFRVPMGAPSITPAIGPAAPEPPSAAPSVATPSVPNSPSRAMNPEETIRMFRFAAWPLLAIGLCLVVVSKGCDMLAARQAAYLEARSTYLANYYVKEDARQTKAAESLKKTILDGQGEAADKQKQIEKIDKDLKDSLESLEKDRTQVTNSHDLVKLDFPVSERSGAYWRAVLFVLGMAGLVIGLVGGFAASEGVDRWGFVILLGVTLFGIFTSSPWH